jgi:hypothetical protein
VAQGRGSIKCGNFLVRFEVLMAMSIKIAVFWDVVPCSLVDTDLLIYVSEELTTSITLMMEAVNSSEMPINIYQTTQCYNPEDSHLHGYFLTS